MTGINITGPTLTLRLRLEEPHDFRAVEELTRDAFWGLFQPVCDEHYLVHIPRGRPCFVPEPDGAGERATCPALPNGQWVT